MLGPESSQHDVATVTSRECQAEKHTSSMTSTWEQFWSLLPRTTNLAGNKGSSGRSQVTCIESVLSLMLGSGAKFQSAASVKQISKPVTLPIVASAAVIATLGPSCHEYEVLVEMLQAGMSCVRVDLTVRSLVITRSLTQSSDLDILSRLIACTTFEISKRLLLCGLGS